MFRNTKAPSPLFIKLLQRQKKTHPPSSQENDSFRNEFHFKETVKRRPNIPKEKARGKREHANDAASLISGET